MKKLITKNDTYRRQRSMIFKVGGHKRVIVT